MNLRIARITAADASDIRRDLLRQGTPSDDVGYDGDDAPTTLHLGAFLDGKLVGISTWLHRHDPPQTVTDGLARDPSTQHDARTDGAPTVQLRGMAVLERYQGHGVGCRLLDAGCEHAQRVGATVIWARARDSALGFYERAGFDTVGDGFPDSDTGLPHHLVRRIP